MSVSQRGNPKNIRATVKAPVREKTFPYAAGLCWCKQPASSCYQSAHYIYTQTHSYHISQNRASEREREEGRERCKVRRTAWRGAKGNSWAHIDLTSASTCRLDAFMTETHFILISKYFWSCCFAFLCFYGKIQHSIKACCCAVVALTTNFDLYAKWLQSKYIYAQGKALSS